MTRITSLIYLDEAKEAFELVAVHENEVTDTREEILEALMKAGQAHSERVQNNAIWSKFLHREFAADEVSDYQYIVAESSGPCIRKGPAYQEPPHIFTAKAPEARGNIPTKREGISKRGRRASLTGDDDAT